MIGQTLDLVSAKDADGFHVRNATLDIFTVIALLVRFNRAGVDDGGCLCASSDLSTQFLRPFVRQPKWRSIPILCCRHPQENSVDASIGDAVVSQWSDLQAPILPTLHPWSCAVPQLIYNRCGNALIDVSMRCLRQFCRVGHH
jgi:hypothetical protein